MKKLVFLLSVSIVGVPAFSQELKPFQYGKGIRITPVLPSFSIDLMQRHDYPAFLDLAPQGGLVDEKVKYDAFFCNLELKSFKKLGVMVKIHAGDYDKYTQPSGRVKR